jgi:hypothetical protein
MQEQPIIWTDRYGGNYPDPATVCKGQCDGMGFYPTNDRTEWPEDAMPDESGYVFVKCAECDGTGLYRDRQSQDA